MNSSRGLNPEAIIATRTCTRTTISLGSPPNKSEPGICNYRLRLLDKLGAFSIAVLTIHRIEGTKISGSLKWNAVSRRLHARRRDFCLKHITPIFNRESLTLRRLYLHVSPFADLKQVLAGHNPHLRLRLTEAVYLHAALLYKALSRRRRSPPRPPCASL